VALHELGHLLPAKLFGTPAPEYFVGFGKKLWSTTKNGTEYGLKLILAGGYTRIEGMFPPKPEGRKDKWFKDWIESAREESAKGMVNYEEPRAFYNLSSPKKLAVMMGGTLTNCVLGFLCFLITFSIIGGPAATTTLSQIVSDSPAALAGLEPDDRITEVDGQLTPSWADVQQLISTGEGDVEIKFVRNGQEMELVIEPQVENGVRRVGIVPTTETKRLNAFETAGVTGNVIFETMKAIVSIPAGMFDAVRSLVTNTKRENMNLVSVIGVGQVAVAAEKAAEDFSQKIANYFSILGSLNIALFVFNLIPLLPLDGGHSANAIYEGLRRNWARIRKRERPQPSDLARTIPIAYFIYGFLILMFIIMVLADIFHPIV
jgi:membrane-associated protease RseP (regulator of RpoE activity)